MQVIRLLLVLAMLGLPLCTPLEAAQPAPPTVSLPEDAVVSNSTTVPADTFQIRLAFDGGEAVVILEDNPSTQSLLSQLPVTITLMDFAGAEKIAYFPQALSTKNAPEGYDPFVGDVACYGPWKNMAIYYEDQPYAAGLIPMGKMTSGMECLAALEVDTAVVISSIQ